MKIEKWDDDSILFSDGSSITYDHYADCCECNYADFSVLDVFYNGETFDDYTIKLEKFGFILVLSHALPTKFNFAADKRIYIPFYSEQNGYYSSDCDLIVRNKDEVKFVSNEGYEFDDYKPSLDPGTLEENYLFGVQCLACSKNHMFVQRPNVFSNRQDAETWIKLHVEESHSSGPKLHQREIKGPKGRTVGYVIDSDI